MKTVSVWSDGAASQFNNRFILAEMKFLWEKHNVQISWNFFLTSRGNDRWKALLMQLLSKQLHRRFR